MAKWQGNGLWIRHRRFESYPGSHPLSLNSSSSYGGLFYEKGIVIKFVSPIFFKQDTITVARQLLGKKLVHACEPVTSGRIVETEAYLFDDPANHAFKGETARNSAMFQKEGTLYIYRIYGTYWCLNIVTSREGIGEAVLIRALEPVDGIKTMEVRRKTSNRASLTNGPGKLVMALGIPPSANGQTVNEQDIRLFHQALRVGEEIAVSSRIGIKKGADLPLRFFLKNNPFVSR